MTPRLAFIVSHPIQYFAPLYQRLARRNDLDLKVFFTWHGGTEAVVDRGFGRAIAWDIPLTEGYDHEVVPNIAADPGTHHFWGLRNPTLVDRVSAWKPDAVHITGWAWASNLAALRAFHRLELPILFRGDSHLLDGASPGPRWWAKKAFLSAIYRWPSAFLVTGSANRAYYKAFGVPDAKLFDCPHTIEAARFAEPDNDYERAAADWRRELGIAPDATVVLFAGKFEPKKRPLEFMRAFMSLRMSNVFAVMLGNGALQTQVDALARQAPERFRILPFQNQSRMPVAYRLGDLFVLPSGYHETWGLAVNEALAGGRPVLVSDRVGCAADVVDAACGRIFPVSDPAGLLEAMRALCANRNALVAMRGAARGRARLFDTPVAEDRTIACLKALISNHR